MATFQGFNWFSSCVVCCDYLSPNLKQPDKIRRSCFYQEGPNVAERFGNAAIHPILPAFSLIPLFSVWKRWFSPQWNGQCAFGTQERALSGARAPIQIELIQSFRSFISWFATLPEAPSSATERSTQQYAGRKVTSVNQSKQLFTFYKGSSNQCFWSQLKRHLECYQRVILTTASMQSRRSLWKIWAPNFFHISWRLSLSTRRKKGRTRIGRY